MIIRCKSGCQVVIGECHWVPGGGAAYLSIGNVKGSMGGIVDPAALDKTIAELTRIRGLLAERAANKVQRRRKKAA